MNFAEIKLRQRLVLLGNVLRTSYFETHSYFVPRLFSRRYFDFVL